MTTKQRGRGEERREHGSGTILEERKLSDGRWLTRWQVSATTPGGQRVRKAGTTRGTKADAINAMQAKRMELAGGAPVTGKDMTVAQLIAATLDEWNTKLKPTTAELYRRTAARYITPHIGNMKIRAVTALDVDGFYKMLRDDVGLGTARRQVHKVLNAAFKYAQRRSLIQFNPAAAVGMPTTAPQTTQEDDPADALKVWTLDEVKRLYDACMADGTPHALAIALALYTGMRRGEIYGLKHGDVDLDAKEWGQIKVRRTLATGGPNGAGEFLAVPKTPRSRRTLDIGPKAQKVLLAATAWQERQKARNPHRWQENDLIFTTAWGTHQHPNFITKKLRQMTAQAGVPFHHLHAARHGWASLAFKAGSKLETVSAYLGHANTNVTAAIYIHWLDDSVPHQAFDPEDKSVTVKRRQELNDLLDFDPDRLISVQFKDQFLPIRSGGHDDLMQTDSHVSKNERLSHKSNVRKDTAETASPAGGLRKKRKVS